MPGRTHLWELPGPVWAGSWIHSHELDFRVRRAQGGRGAGEHDPVSFTVLGVARAQARIGKSLGSTRCDRVLRVRCLLDEGSVAERVACAVGDETLRKDPGPTAHGHLSCQLLRDRARDILKGQHRVS